MKITKRQLRRIIKEERKRLQEAAMVGPLPSKNVYDYVHDEVLELIGEFLTGYGVAQEYGNFTEDDIRSLEMLVQEAAKEAVGTALSSVGFSQRVG